MKPCVFERLCRRLGRHLRQAAGDTGQKLRRREIRILTDSGRVGLDRFYPRLYPLSDRGDITLVLLSLRLIHPSGDTTRCRCQPLRQSSGRPPERRLRISGDGRWKLWRARPPCLEA